MSSSKKYDKNLTPKSDCDLGANAKPTDERETVAKNLWILAQTVQQILNTAEELQTGLKELSSLIETYGEFVREVTQSRFRPLIKITMRRFLTVLKKKEYFESEVQANFDANKLLILTSWKPEYEKMTRDESTMQLVGAMMEWPMKDIKAIGKSKDNLNKLKEEWDSVNLLLETKDCVRLVQELCTKLRETEVKEVVAESAQSSTTEDSPIIFYLNNDEDIKRFKEAMKEMRREGHRRMYHWPAMVYNKRIDYILDLNQQLKKEVTEVNRKIERFGKLHKEIETSKLAPLLHRIAIRFVFVTEKGKYFQSKLEIAKRTQSELMEGDATCTIGMEEDELQAFMHKYIPKCGSASELVGTLDKLKIEWEAVREKVNSEAMECVRLVEELYARLKKESK